MKREQKPIKIEEGDNFKTILSKYGCLALDRQENLFELIGDLEGDLDLDTGILKFSEDIEFPVQILGIFNEEFGQWSWAWDNEDIGFDESLIEDAKKIHDIGEEFEIAEFTTPVFESKFDECHIWVMTAASILDLDAYYASRVGNFDIFVGIKSDLIERNESTEKFRQTYATFHKNFNIFDTLAFEGYAKLKGYIYKRKEDFAVAKIGEDRVIAGFTERGNLTHIQMLTAD